MPRYDVFLMTAYCVESINAKDENEARRKFMFPPEFDMNDEHCLVVVEEDEDFYEKIS